MNTFSIEGDDVLKGFKNRLVEIVSMRPLTYNNIIDSNEYYDTKDTGESTKIYANTRMPSAEHDERKETYVRDSSDRDLESLIENHIGWIAPESRSDDGEGFRKAKLNNFTSLARYPDGSFRPPEEEIKPSLQQASLSGKLKELMSRNNSEGLMVVDSIDSTSPQAERLERIARIRRLKQRFEKKLLLNLTQHDHRFKSPETRDESSRDDRDDSAERNEISFVRKDSGLLRIGAPSVGIAQTDSSDLMSQFLNIGLVNVEKLINVAAQCSSPHLQTWTECHTVDREKPESNRHTELKILGRVSCRDEFRFNGNLFDEELESSTKLCFGQGIHRWLGRRKRNSSS